MKEGRKLAPFERAREGYPAYRDIEKERGQSIDTDKMPIFDKGDRAKEGGS